MYSGLANIFGGGDFRRGPATAIEAIADGRIAAEQIDYWLKHGKFEKHFASIQKSKKLADVSKRI